MATEQRTGASLIIAGSGAMALIVVGMVIFLPNVATWIAASSGTEIPQAAAQSHPSELSATPMRRPITLGAWADVLPRRVDTRHVERVER